MRNNSRAKTTDLDMLGNHSKLKQQTVLCPLFLAISFFLPFTIMGLSFVLHGVYPFGGRQILTGDLFYQHYPFLSSFWHKVREGGLSPWSWTGGAGYDFTALFAYFLSSPLNLLVLIFPHEWLRETQTIILLVKIGCAGLFTTMFLHYTFRKSGYEMPILSSLYALCAFTLGYYYSIASFDSFALLPLVVMGLLALINENKFKLYTVSLALAVFANFYMGFFVCIFSAITFLCFCIIKKLSRQEFLCKLGLTSACTALAIGMTAVILLPTSNALRYVYSGGNFPVEMSLHHSFFDVLGNFISFTLPTTVRGLPNLYSGLLSILLSGLYFFSRKVTRREKIMVLVILIFLIVSCNLNVLEYIMHGFRFPNGVPSRFSFLISFILVVITYRGYLLTESIGKQYLLAMGISGPVFLFAAIFGSQDNIAVIGSAVLCSFYLVLLAVKNIDKLSMMLQKLIKTVFFLLILTELLVNSWISVEANGSTDRNLNTDYYNQIQGLLEMCSHDTSSGINIYRAEIASQGFNASSLFNYNGISIFSSTINVNTARFMRGLGLRGFSEGADFYYIDTSPLTSTFLNLRYIIQHKANAEKILDIYWDFIGEAGYSILFENKRYLPLGFMVKEDMADYKHEENLFFTQNNLFRRATGFKDDLFKLTKLTLKGIPAPNANRSEEGFLYESKVPSDGVYYIFPASYNSNVYDEERAISPVGYLEKNKIFDYKFSNSADVFLGRLDTELFDRGYSLLASQPLILNKFTNTQVCGTVTALEDGLLYTSIPADKNWSVYVDGVKSKIVLIDNAMAAVRLDKGKHQIEFRYFNTSLVVGIAVSLVSLAVFMALVIWKKGIVNRE